MSKWCLLQLLVCVTLHISDSDAVCSGSDREVIYDYDNQKDFKIKIVKNADNLDASLSLRGSPPPGELTMKSKKQRIFITSKSGTFSLQKIQFKVQGIIGASATFYRQERVKSKTKVRKITKKWTIIKDSFGFQFPDRGMSDLEKMVLVFKLKAQATSVSVKDLVMHVCIKGKGDGGSGGLAVPDCEFYKDKGAKCVAKCEGGAGCENVPGCGKGEICCFPVEKEYWPRDCVSEKLCRDFPGGECKASCGESDGFICGNLDCADSNWPKCCMTKKSKQPPRCGRQQIPFK